MEDKLITTEDPVEYDIDGIIQCPIDPGIGVTFASCLRAILRQDPDRILVGEIRDTETAEIAVQASLTGHLVFSTLHTNDAPSAVTRLVDMGVEAYLVASSLVAVLAQRLVRQLCPACKEPYVPRPEDLAEIGVRTNGPVTIHKAVGCAACHHTGYRGRLGIFELMIVDDDIRALATQNIDSKTIKKKAIQNGMKTLRSDGARKVLEGITSIEEVLRATEDEGVVAQI
jgi:general secretion pathway protein E